MKRRAMDRVAILCRYQLPVPPRHDPDPIGNIDHPLYDGKPPPAVTGHGKAALFRRNSPECRVSARDTCRGLLLPTGLAQWRQPCFATVRPASVRFATPSQARCWLRRTPTNGWTACRMPLQIFSAGSGKHTPPPLRKSVRALRLPWTTGLRVALHGRQRWLTRIARKQPTLFAHWRLLYAAAGR